MKEIEVIFHWQCSHKIFIMQTNLHNLKNVLWTIAIHIRKHPPKNREYHKTSHHLEPRSADNSLIRSAASSTTAKKAKNTPVLAKEIRFFPEPEPSYAYPIKSHLFYPVSRHKSYADKAAANAFFPMEILRRTNGMLIRRAFENAKEITVKDGCRNSPCVVTPLNVSSDGKKIISH